MIYKHKIAKHDADDEAVLNDVDDNSEREFDNPMAQEEDLSGIQSQLK